MHQKWHCADICVHISFCSTDYPQKLKISTQEKFWLQRSGGSEQRDKRPQIGLKNDKRTQIGKMPIARRSSAPELGERFDVNFSVCLLHAALPEILLPASSVQAAPARIGHRPNVLEEQFFCRKVDLINNSRRCLFNSSHLWFPMRRLAVSAV